MTQNQLKILTLLSISTFIFVIFDTITILTFAISAFLIHRLLKITLKRHLQRGLIDHLPQGFQNNLLNKSIIDLITDIWYYQIFKFIKLLLKPLLYPVDHQNTSSSIQAFQQYKTTGRSKFMSKEIIKIMPNSCQMILLGKQRLRQMEEQQINVYRKYQKQQYSDRFTDDQSEKENYRVKNIISPEKQKQIAYHHEIQQEKNQKNIENQLKFDDKFRQKVDEKIQVKNTLAKKRRKNIIQIAQQSFAMVKRLIQLQNVPRKILRIDTLTIVKLMMVFWIILLVQIKYNKNGRQIVIKILHILGGIISVFGVVGTTGMLIYKGYSKKQNKEIKNREDL